MDRSLDEIVAERQRGSFRGRRGAPPPRRSNYNNYPRDGIRKSTKDSRTNLDNDWVHDRYDDDAGGPRSTYSRSRGRRDDYDDRPDEKDRERAPPVAKIRVDNLHYDLTEDDIYELFSRIAPVNDVRMRYDRAGRSEGIAFVTYDRLSDAREAVKQFDGANAKGQPIRLQVIPLPRRDNPFDRAENPRSLFDRVEQPSSRSRRRSDSPMSDVDGEPSYRRGLRRGPPRDRRSDVTKPAPENIDRYVPSQTGRSSSHRGGRRPGERRERRGRDEGGHKMVNGRPKKTQEELDAEMEDYFAGTGDTAQTDAGAPAVDQTANGATAATNDDDIDMIE